MSNKENAQSFTDQLAESRKNSKQENVLQENIEINNQEFKSKNKNDKGEFDLPGESPNYEIDFKQPNIFKQIKDDLSPIISDIIKESDNAKSEMSNISGFDEQISRLKEAQKYFENNSAYSLTATKTQIQELENSVQDLSQWCKEKENEIKNPGLAKFSKVA